MVGNVWIPAVVLGAVMAASCEFPRDAAGTLERVRREQVVRVGYSERPPWVRVEGGRPVGIEPRLIEAFASRLGAKPLWVAGTETSLVEALRERRIDVLIGGHDLSSPWVGHAAATEPHVRTAIIIAAPHGRSPAAASDLEGRTVAHAKLRPDLAALIAAEEAKPEAAADLGGRLAAVYDFQARSLGLEPTGIVLARMDMVLLVAPGESRFLFELDSFLAREGRRAATTADKAEGS